MTVEEQTTTNAGSETIVEDTGSNEPANTDYSQENKSDDTTSQNDTQSENGENGDNQTKEDDFYVANFKDKEAADKGFKDLQAKLTEQANTIKDLNAKLSKSETAQQLPDVNAEIQVARQGLFDEYNKRIQGLGYKYGSFVPEDAQIRTINDIVQYLPPVEASQFTREFMTVQNDFNFKMQAKINEIQQNANSKFEELKAKDKERFKDNLTVFEAWYNPPETIDGVAELVEKVKKQAIEDYIKKQAAAKEDEQHKSKLGGGGNSRPNYESGHIFTNEEIGKMSMSEFKKYEKIIDSQVSKGLIK